MAAAESDSQDGALGVQLGALESALGGGQDQEVGPTEPWTSDALESFDLSQEGSVKFNQMLDLFDATVTIDGGQGGQAITFTSPLTSLPLDMANSTPTLNAISAVTNSDSFMVARFHRRKRRVSG